MSVSKNPGIISLIKQALSITPAKEAENKRLRKKRQRRIRNKLSRELRRNQGKGVMASPKVMRNGKIKNRLSGSAKRYRKVRKYGNYPQRKKIPMISIVEKEEL